MLNPDTPNHETFNFFSKKTELFFPMARNCLLISMKIKKKMFVTCHAKNTWSKPTPQRKPKKTYKFDSNQKKYCFDELEQLL